ncbi:MAG: tRNA dihydrouridine synthase DusB [Spirochaetales bacterium]|nr:tRNA dihydrouridine synthase DusB [Candidatus Physcosoma equi]
MENKEDRLVLAPLAGYTDKAFRQMATEMGADICVTEMVSAEGLARNGEKTKELLERFEGEDRMIVQLFGPDKDPVERSIENLMLFHPTQVDFNCGCPVPKVVKTGAGSALMQTPKKITEIVRVLKKETGLPVSVKFRLGWDSSSINYLEFADAAAEGGADIMTLHARTRAQGYEGKADRNAFRALSEHFQGTGIRLYASGDIFTPEDAISVINECGMYGVMFARGAIGNPFIFRETKEYLETGSYTLPTVQEKIEGAMRHFSLMEHYYGEYLAGKEMRKHAMAYIKGTPGASRCKLLLTKANTKEEYREAFEALF